MLLSEMRSVLDRAWADIRWSDTHFGEDKFDSASLVSLHMAEARILAVIASCLLEEIISDRLREEREEMRQVRSSLGVD